MPIWYIYLLEVLDLKLPTWQPTLIVRTFTIGLVSQGPLPLTRSRIFCPMLVPVSDSSPGSTSKFVRSVSLPYGMMCLAVSMECLQSLRFWLSFRIPRVWRWPRLVIRAIACLTWPMFNLTSRFEFVSCYMPRVSMPSLTVLLPRQLVDRVIGGCLSYGKSWFLSDY